MSLTIAVATIRHIRGETITWGLRSDPAYDGTETVTCDLKLAINGAAVPPDSAPVVQAVTPAFVAAGGDEPAYWSFTLTAAQSAGMNAGNYITDAKVIYASGAVDYPEPLGIRLAERVTA